LHDLQKELGDSINWHGEAFDAPVNQVLVKIWHKIGDALTSNVKGIGDLKSEWQDLYVGKKAMAGSLDKDTVGVGTGAPAPTTPTLYDKTKGVVKKYGPAAVGLATVGKIGKDLLKP
jgi:hypothetical protein